MIAQALKKYRKAFETQKKNEDLTQQNEALVEQDKQQKELIDGLKQQKEALEERVKRQGKHISGHGLYLDMITAETGQPKVDLQ
jgi:cell division protein FtsB